LRAKKSHLRDGSGPNKFSIFELSEETMTKITRMPMLNATATTQAVTETGAQRAGIILALAFLLTFAPIAGAQFTPLYNFGTHAGDPAHPNYPGFVVQGRDGNLYSTSCDGGTDNYGTVFKITPAGQVTVLYSFDGVTGAFPSGGLTLGTDGNFYGSTFEGGPSTNGTVFKITPSGKLTVLHAFDGSDGSAPWGRRSKARMALSTELRKMADR
jgi:uncharacterized repeat protein (TIGR03803 family)